MNLNGLHKDLLSNCNRLIARLNKAEETMTAGHIHQQASQMVSGGPPGGTITIDTNVDSDDLRVLTHAFIIQEWHLYLDNLFEKVVAYNLLHSTMPKLSKMNIKIDFNDIDIGTPSKARMYICSKLKESFSFEGYDEKIDIIKKLVDFQPYFNSELPFIRKSVIVRNIFQHQKGEVSSRDLERLGGSLTLLDDVNTPVKFGTGDKLKISKAEIKELYNMLNTITNNLQVKS